MSFTPPKVHPPQIVWLRNALIQGEDDLSLTQKTFANTFDMKLSQYNTMRNRHVARASLELAVAIAHQLVYSLDELPNRDTPLYLHRDGPVAWRASRGPTTAMYQAMRIAAGGVLDGKSPDEIAHRLGVMRSGRGRPALEPGEGRLRELAAGALDAGVIELSLSDSATEMENRELAGELVDALRADGDGTSSPEVTVVRNVCHPDFEHDPIAPWLIARAAHTRVAHHLAAGRPAFRVGLAGGRHCATFVRAIGPSSSPFPDPSGDKRLTFVPLTLEPFVNHKLELADAAVGQISETARYALGADRVEAPTLQSFGYLLDREVALEHDAITLVREHYNDLDVAIFGCGDLVHDGWLEQLLRRLNFDLTTEPVTDVCLNLLGREGQAVPLPGGRRFIGAGLPDIQRMVWNPRKLALLLTSGEAKGLPITVVARARAASGIICDEMAARSALAELERRRGPQPVAA